MIDYEKWLSENTVEYHGYKITNGSVRRNGDWEMVSHHPLSPTDEQKAELLADAKRWVDERIDGKAVA